MRLNELYKELGRGFGIFQALKAFTLKVDTLRHSLENGRLSREEAMLKELEYFTELESYANNPKWQDVLKNKKDGEEAVARSVAKDIMDEHRLTFM
jgi:hypothetical protein